MLGDAVEIVDTTFDNLYLFKVTALILGWTIVQVSFGNKSSQNLMLDFQFFLCNY